MKFKVQSLLMAALAVAAIAPLARAVDSVQLNASSLAGATAVGGGALPGSSPTFTSSNHLYIYGSVPGTPGVYSVNYSTIANLAAGEGFSGIAASFIASPGVTVPATPYTPDAAAVWTFTLPGATQATINNFYNNQAVVANIGPYTSADATRSAFAQSASAPVGTMKFQWDGSTNNATVKLGDATNDGITGQIQYQIDNTSTGVVGNAQFNADPSTVQFVSALPGDANLDGSVALSDYLVLSQNFGKPGNWTQGDFNNDGQVNLADYLSLSQNFGKTWTTGLTPAFGASIAAAPEPASLGVLAIAAAGLVARRKNRNV